MEIRFKFHPDKAVQATAILLKSHGKPMPCLSLLKLLYIAERTALERLEQPIIGDRYISTHNGPILSHIYDLIKGKKVGGANEIWSKYISSVSSCHKTQQISDDYTVCLLNEPGDDELSEEETEILNEVYTKYGQVSFDDLGEIKYLFPEWRKPHSRALPINIEEILKNLGKTDEEVIEIRENSEREQYLDWVLNGR